MPRLRRVDCSMPGITRRKAGRGFYYVDARGRKVGDPEVLERVRALAVPPAWTDVWICPFPNGHIQAVGVDARGRRQYRYHDAWRVMRDREKFDHMLLFARALPGLRRHCLSVLADPSGEHTLDRARVMAAAVRLLDLGFFRIGTEGYAEENQSYGLATVERRHVRVSGDTLTFDYTAKAGKRRLQTVVDPLVADVVRELKRCRGRSRRLLVHRQGRRWVEITSDDINAHIQEVTGGDFTAKEFRTWSATVLAAVALAVSSEVTSVSGRKRAVARAMKEVAHYLGNTPAVARTSYVDPRVVDLYNHGVTVKGALGRIGTAPAAVEAAAEAGGEAGDSATPGSLAIQGAVERAVLRMISDAAAPTGEDHARRRAA